MFNFIIFDAKVSTWKVILVIIAVLLFLFVLIGLLGNLIRYTMKKQAKAVDKDMGKLVVSRIIKTPEEFKTIAYQKSLERFYKQSIAPFIILLTCLILYIIYHSIYGNWLESIFDRETGIASLLYILDFSSVEYYPPFGSNFDSWVWLTPEPFTDEKIFNYFIFLTLIVGTIYYLVVTQAYIARKLYIKKLSKSLFSAKLEEMNLSSFYNTNNLSNIDENSGE